ncbi:MAG: putative replication initiation protein [Microviridae sp.]|nr:MAG: putative replication initiation protein [Microviridae sp.]
MQFFLDNYKICVFLSRVFDIINIMFKNFVNIYTGEIVYPNRLPVKYHANYSHEKYLRIKYGNWVNRLGFEKLGRKGSFITLTYNPENYDGEPHYEHLQKFMKRVRRYMDYHKLPTSDGQPLRYFFCVERGKKTDRLHYHGIIFGLPKIIRTMLGLGKNDPYAGNLWNYGFAQCRALVNRRVLYVCKYIFKQQDGKTYKTLKSRNIGSSLFEDCNKELRDYFRRNLTIELHSGLKHPFRVPRIYRPRLFRDSIYRFKDTLKACFPKSNPWKWQSHYEMFKEKVYNASMSKCHPFFNGGYLELGRFGEYGLVAPICDYDYNKYIDIE